LKDSKEVILERGQVFTLIADENVVGDRTRVGVLFKNLPNVVKKGSTILIDDGLIQLTVVSVSGNSIECLVMNQGILGDSKGVHLPNVNLDLPGVGEKELPDIQFAIDQNVDFLAVSSVTKADDINFVRNVLAKAKSGIKVIAKIDSRHGLDHFDSILKVSDGILVSRGDLGVDIPIEQMSLAQKMIIRKSNAAGKFVITATQMLDSMVKNPSPTRAEASDVANAVLDGTDCVTLSGETAHGLYPVEAVKMMADICREAEVTFVSRPHDIFQSELTTTSKISIAESIAAAAVKAAFDLQASMVVVLTESGNTARLVAKYRPAAPILAITSSERSARQCLVTRGLFPLLVGSMSGTASLTHRAIRTAAETIGMCKIGDRVVVTSGHEGVSGATDDLKVIQVAY